MATDPLRILVLWNQMSGYLDACLRTLDERPGVEVLVVYRLPSGAAPFDPDRFASVKGGYGWSDHPDRQRLAQIAEQFRPDAILVCSWARPEYNELAGSLRHQTTRVLCTDSQWLGTPRQMLGIATRKFHLQPNFDVIFVPGDTHASFARRLGFNDGRQLRGLYCADYGRFAPLCPPEGRNLPRSFAFIGRLVSEKGVDVLAEAYAAYRAKVADPWPLVVAGVGPLESALQSIEGVDRRGFVQPDELPDLLGEVGALVLPSRFEPWGVVVHEAAAAGLPIIATPACGASARLLLDGYNGLRVQAGSVDSLTQAFVRFSSYDTDRRRTMSAASSSLARQYTPQRWAWYLEERLRGFGARWGTAPLLPD